MASEGTPAVLGELSRPWLGMYRCAHAHLHPLGWSAAAGARRLASRRPGPTPRRDLVPELRSPRCPAGLPPGCVAAAQLRVRGCGDRLPGGAARRATLRARVLGGGDDMDP